jgi:tetratricopeptide (TPR) repeat protein
MGDDVEPYASSSGGGVGTAPSWPDPAPILNDLMETFGPLFAAIGERYSIVREIGRGGMAVVFLAHDRQHHREVAIKVLRPELSASLTEERFLIEIRVVSALTHGRILPVLDSGEAVGFLYYVMPYVSGETLRDRLKRERQLPIPDAIGLAREIAEALHYAHGRNIIHRDIKPENILLADGHAVVADFGLARAVNIAGGERLTSSGLVVGTPAYMSPEQGSEGANVDARTDVYALACVVYEMLVGEPPFTGPNSQVVITRHMHERPRSVRMIRSTVPAHVEDALEVALAKTPADRFADSMRFADALGGDSRALPWRRRLMKVSRPVVTTIATATVILVLSRWGPLAPTRGVVGAPLDTTQYAILPFEYQSGVQTSLNEEQRLHDAFARWTGISVSDPVLVRDLIGRQGTSNLTARQAMSLARRLGAGRYVRAAVSLLGPDSLRIQGWLYNSGNGAVLADQVVRVRLDLSASDSAFAAMADRMLLRGAFPESDAQSSATRSLPSRQAFLRGQRALSEWRLAVADSAFSAAAEFDGSSAEAHLWVAIVRAWSGAEPARWQVPAEQAHLGQAMLSDRDGVLAAAIAAQSRDDMARACPLWESLTRPNRQDFVAWYGFAYCQAIDSAVIADARSPSRWRFRTSYQNALAAYRRAFELNPGALAAFRQSSFASLRRLFKISGSSIRTGAPVPPDSGGFIAYPSWVGDSVAYVPYPRREMSAYRITAADQEAVRRLRIQFRDFATAWVAGDPTNAAALEALAISLSTLGNISGLDTLRRARALSDNATDRYRMAVLEVWMGLSFAVPHDVGRVVSVRSLADSLLRDSLTAANPALGTWLAALTGRAGQAASLTSSEQARQGQAVPAPLRPHATTLLIYAAFGGPTDTLAHLASDVESVIARSLSPAQRNSARRTWLARSATLAFSTYRFEALATLAGLNPLLDAQIAWASGDTTAARRGLRAISELRANSLPWNLSIDALYPEAELLVAMGELRRAADWLGPTLDALPQLAPQIESPERIATLVRSMALRARIAEQLGRPDDARRWAAAVVTLWSDADPFLQPMVQSLRRLAR